MVWSPRDGGPGRRLSTTGAVTSNIALSTFPLSVIPLPTTSTGSDTSTTDMPSSSDTSVPGSSGSNSDSTSDSATPSITISPTNPVPTATQSQGSPGNPHPISWWSFVKETTTATTCQPYQINWTVFNSTSPDLLSTHLRLYITSSDLNQTLVANHPILNDNYTWPAVTVPPGIYGMHGVETDGLYPREQSYSFSVQAGSNTTCLSSTGSGSAAGTQNGTPISTASKGSGTNTAAIAGGTVGGVALLACAGVAVYFLCFLRKRRQHPSTRSRGFRKDRHGLNSVDSKLPIVPEGSLQGHGQEELEQRQYEGADDYATRRESAIRAITAARVESSSSLEGEKAMHLHDAPAGRGEAFSRHDSFSSTNVFETDSAGHSHGVIPRPVELAQLSSRPNVHDSPRSSFDFNDPLASPTLPNSRRASRTPRKPVPAYDPTPDELEVMAMQQQRAHSESRSSVTHPSSIFNNPSTYSHHTSSLSTSPSHFGEAMLHGLKSKSSGQFDGQPMHYIIPDMPSAPLED